MVAAAVCALMVGCGKTSPPATVPIRLWTHWNGGELAILRDETERFEREHPGTRVEITAIEFDRFSAELDATLHRNADSAPDVFTGINDWIGNFAEKSLILPIDYLPLEKPDEFLSYTYAACQYQDRLYGFPVSYECIALFYNRRMVKKVPPDFAGWVKLARSLTDPASGRWGLVYDLAQPYFNMPWLMAGGYSLLTDSGDPQFVGRDKQRWLEDVGELQKPGGIVPPRSLGLQEKAVDVFAQGDAAFFIGGPWDIPKLTGAGIDFGVTRLPKMPGGAWAAPLIGVKAIFLTGKGDRPAVRELVRFLGRAQLQLRYAVETARIPSLKAIYEDPVITRNEHLLAFADQATVGVAMPNAPEIYAVWKPLQELAFRPFLEGTMTAQEGLGQAQRAAEDEIVRYHAELESR